MYVGGKDHAVTGVAPDGDCWRETQSGGRPERLAQSACRPRRRTNTNTAAAMAARPATMPPIIPAVALLERPPEEGVGGTVGSGVGPGAGVSGDKTDIPPPRGSVRVTMKRPRLGLTCRTTGAPSP